MNATKAVPIDQLMSPGEVWRAMPRQDSIDIVSNVRGVICSLSRSVWKSDWENMKNIAVLISSLPDLCQMYVDTKKFVEGERNRAGLAPGGRFSKDPEQ